jgi:manganese/iron transport system substrate-binding protein
MLTLSLAACGDTPPTNPSAGSNSPAKKLKVVTTVAPVTNIVLNIGGSRLDLKGLIPDGTDSHTFEPAPSDAKLFADADLIIVNGLRLEEPSLKMAESSKKATTPILNLGENTITEKDWIFDFSFPKDKGYPNPHLWMNPKYALNYGKLVYDALVKQDSAGKEYYDKNLAAFTARVQALDEGIKKASQTVPADQRKLLTYHDSWAYWAREYGWQVLGAIQPSSFTEPTDQEVSALLDQIKQTKVKAIFGSEVFPSAVLEKIASETGTKFIDKLRDDEPPGDAKSPEHTYYGLMLDDMQIMLPALGGNVEALKSVGVENTYSK